MKLVLFALLFCLPGLACDCRGYSDGWVICGADLIAERVYGSEGGIDLWHHIDIGPPERFVRVPKPAVTAWR